jgi:hypothetical protein
MNSEAFSRESDCVGPETTTWISIPEILSLHDGHAEDQIREGEKRLIDIILYDVDI